MGYDIVLAFTTWFCSKSEDCGGTEEGAGIGAGVAGPRAAPIPRTYVTT